MDILFTIFTCSLSNCKYSYNQATPSFWLSVQILGYAVCILCTPQAKYVIFHVGWCKSQKGSATLDALCAYVCVCVCVCVFVIFVVFNPPTQWMEYTPGMIAYQMVNLWCKTDTICLFYLTGTVHWLRLVYIWNSSTFRSHSLRHCVWLYSSDVFCVCQWSDLGVCVVTVVQSWAVLQWTECFR